MQKEISIRSRDNIWEEAKEHWGKRSLLKKCDPAIRTAVRALRHAVLPPHHEQQRASNDLRRRERADAKHGRGWQGLRH